MASEAAWLKTVPRAMAEGLTGGRSTTDSQSIGPMLALLQVMGSGGFCVERCLTDLPRASSGWGGGGNVQERVAIVMDEVRFGLVWGIERWIGVSKRMQLMKREKEEEGGES